jgi:phenylacetic acid degradation operon negative regulatory protein
MHARSLLFDVYGDHLRARGGWAPVAGLVRLLEPLDVAAPAVRTAISRMVAQGWLTAENVSGSAGYALTPRADQRLDEALARVYRTGRRDWDGHWQVLVLALPGARPARERVRQQLRFHGYAPLSDTTWVSPRPVDVAATVADEGGSVVTFTSADPAPVAALVEAFEPQRLATSYAAWLDSARALVLSQPADSDRDAFGVRSRLVHEWRKFLFHDPGLPAVLLPEDWPGHAAAAFFDQESERLLPAARRFIDECLLTRGELP